MMEMSEIFGAKVVGVVAATFLSVVTIYLLSSLYVLSLFEAVLGVASTMVFAALIINRLVKSEYKGSIEEDSSQELS